MRPDAEIGRFLPRAVPAISRNWCSNIHRYDCGGGGYQDPRGIFFLINSGCWIMFTVVSGLIQRCMYQRRSMNKWGIRFGKLLDFPKPKIVLREKLTLLVIHACACKKCFCRRFADIPGQVDQSILHAHVLELPSRKKNIR